MAYVSRDQAKTEQVAKAESPAWYSQQGTKGVFPPLPQILKNLKSWLFSEF